MTKSTSRFDKLYNVFQDSFHLSKADALKATAEFEKVLDENRSQNRISPLFSTEEILKILAVILYFVVGLLWGVILAR